MRPRISFRVARGCHAACRVQPGPPQAPPGSRLRTRRRSPWPGPSPRAQKASAPAPADGASNSLSEAASGVNKSQGHLALNTALPQLGWAGPAVAELSPGARGPRGHPLASQEGAKAWRQLADHGPGTPWPGRSLSHGLTPAAAAALFSGGKGRKPRAGGPSAGPPRSGLGTHPPGLRSTGPWR